ncbi:unnamed protein product [Phytophthora fragariaefolia]|uniref:protein-tyrosine-phosphatase n=1 Tax=Phytophthora fragariaefolia TaxID=1490495 RepID=A0A9W6XLR7_9STRA|nr:unnamed protein product [Phytophthora fragariaefolia]
MTSIASSAVSASTLSTELYDRVELLPGKLDFALLSSTLAVCSAERITLSKQATHCESIPANYDDLNDEFILMDGDLVYARFFADFGPLHLARTVRFCRGLEARLDFTAVTGASRGDNSRKRLVMYCSDHPHKRANAMTLLAIFLVMVRGLSPELAVKRVLKGGQLLPPFGFRDASCGVCTFFITLLDCARAVHKAVTTSLWSYQAFSVDEYDRLDCLENGDINWIVPGKLIAFSGPQRERIILDTQSGATTLLARDYAARFRTLGVTCVIRFNEATTYDRKAFVHAGLRHIDMPFPDGSNPNDEILFKFIRVRHQSADASPMIVFPTCVSLQICERETGAVAVHCKAGLGRTGTAIAAFLMKNYRFSATEAIAWCRICRPGSIVGPQQHFLAVKEPDLHALPSIFEVQPVSKPVQAVQRQPKKSVMPNKLELLPSYQQPNTTRASSR